MTDKNKTEIIVVLDRSGSMETIRADMEGGFNSFIAEQRKLPGECAVTLWQFDTDCETVYTARPIAEVPPLRLEPRGSTALYDATGRAINAIGARLDLTAEARRPGAVVFLIITDGQENASREYTRGQVREMIDLQKTKYNWQFAYLGSDASTWAEARSLGTQSYSYNATPQGVLRMYAAAGQSIGNYRYAVTQGIEDAKLELDEDAGEA